MISITQYIGPFAKCGDLTPPRYANAQRLLLACNRLEALALYEGVNFLNNPKTRSGISGETYGGFRPQCCQQGSEHSAHKEALAVDRYDPGDVIDKWVFTSPAALALATELGMYFEHPSATPGWSHWSIKAPPSGHRFFYP